MEKQMVLQMNYWETQQLASTNCCEVCGANLSHADTLYSAPLNYRVCSAYVCRHTMKQKAVIPEALFKANLAFAQKLQQESRAQELDRQRRIEATFALETQENEQQLARALTTYPHLSEHTTELTVIPTGRTALAPLSSARIEEYRQHLYDTLAAAAGLNDITEIASDQNIEPHKNLVDQELWFQQKPPIKTVSDYLCEMCKGGCCHSAKNHAYLSVYSMRRVMDENPELTQAAIVERYVSHLSSSTVKNSCINQTERGCALPRELRSDICNGFYCEPLKRLQVNLDKREDVGTVVAVQRAHTYSNLIQPDVANGIIATALVCENGIRTIEFGDA